MYLVRDADNVLTESMSEHAYELHIQQHELVVIVGPQGDEMYLSVGDDTMLKIEDAFGTELRKA